MLFSRVDSKWIGAYALVVVTCVLIAAAAISNGRADAATTVAASQRTEPCVWVIFIDDLHLNFPATGRLKGLLSRLFAQLVQEGDLVSVVSTGPSSIAIDLTRDRAKLAVALDRLSGAGLHPSEMVQDGSSSENRYRAHVAFNTAYGVMKMLASVRSTQQAFIFISNGYYVDIWAGGVRMGSVNPFTLRRNAISLEEVRDEVAELCAEASRVKVPIYAIDPRDLSGPPTIDPKLDDAAWQNYLTTTRNSLRVIAQETGGFLVEEELESGLKRIGAAKGR